MQPRETLKPDTDPCAVTSIVIGTFEGALMMIRLDEASYALEIARDHLISWMESLRVEKRVSASQRKTKRLCVTPE